MNISIPFDHPSVPPSQGTEKSRARGRYVSVEYVKEIEGGNKVEWLMATASCAGGTSILKPRLGSFAHAVPLFRIDPAIPDELEPSGQGHRGEKVQEAASKPRDLSRSRQDVPSFVEYANDKIQSDDSAKVSTLRL
jgi:hypothetical protein